MNENFLINFVKLSDGTEIPRIYALWSGVSAISAALGRRVFIDMGHFAIYPNLYVVLSGSSGLRKSSAIRMASSLLAECTPAPNLISPKTTPEALIDAMRSSDAQHLLSESSTAFAFIDELITFLNKKTYEGGLASLLLDFYDSPETWSYRTKARGLEKLNQPCLGILAGSTIENIRDAIPPEAVGSGLTSRIIFVYTETRPPPAPFTKYSTEQLEARTRLLESLKRFYTLQGPVTFDEEAREYYEAEYIRYYNAKEVGWGDKVMAGYAQRRAVQWLKLSIIFAAADGTLKLTVRHLEGALKMLHQCELHREVVMKLISSSDQGGLMSKIEGFIKHHKKVSRSELVKSMGHQVSVRQLSEIIDTLLVSKVIVSVLEGKDLVYVYNS